VSDPAGAEIDLAGLQLQPLSEDLYDGLVTSLRASLGAGWGKPSRKSLAALRSLVTAARDIDDVHVASSSDHPQRKELRIDLWVDKDDLDPLRADHIVQQVLRGLGDREMLIVCRAYDVDAILYRFATGNVESGVTGAIALVGPYARDVATLARLGKGQTVGFSA
jgi:hypothetical protein